MNREQRLEQVLQEIIRWAKSSRLTYEMFYPPKQYSWEEGYADGLEYVALIAEKALRGDDHE